MHRYADWITAAHDESDRDKSVALWQRSFGPDSKAPGNAAALIEGGVGKVLVKPTQAPQEELITGIHSRSATGRPSSAESCQSLAFGRAPSATWAGYRSAGLAL
jgi:hypothetical protein